MHFPIPPFFNARFFSIELSTLPIIIIIIFFFFFFTPWEFFTLALADGLSLNLSNIKSPQASRRLFSILADLNNALVWTVSTLPVISKSSSPCTSSLVIEPRVWITIDITVTFMFHSFFNSLARSGYLSFFSFFFFQFYSVICWDSKVHNSTCYFFFVDYYKVGSSGRD